jgi:hypothetical protein
MLLDSADSEYVPVADCCEHGNKPSGFVKCLVLPDQLSRHQLLKNSAFHGVG